MTKYVVSGYIGFDNFGDEAIARVLTDYLKSVGADKITLISSNPEKTSKLYGVESCGMLKFFKPILESDVLISGGGSLLQDVTSLKSLIYYLLVIFTALFFRKKVIIFAQGFTPFRTRLGQNLTRQILKHCDKISVRDKKSQKILEDMNIKSTLVTDPVFGIKVPDYPKSGVGIQLRSFPTLTDEFLEKLAQEVKTRFPNEEIKLFSLQDSMDLEVLEKFASYGINAKIYKEDIINEISKLEYLIAMRFHACLVGAKSGVNVIGINYDIKVKTLSEEIGFPVIELNKPEFSDELFKHREYKIPDFSFENVI